MNEFKTGPVPEPISAPVLGPALRAGEQPLPQVEEVPEPLAPFFAGGVGSQDAPAAQHPLGAQEPAAQVRDELPWLDPADDAPAQAAPAWEDALAAGGAGEEDPQPAAFLEDLPALDAGDEEDGVVPIESLAPDAEPLAPDLGEVSPVTLEEDAFFTVPDEAPDGAADVEQAEPNAVEHVEPGTAPAEAGELDGWEAALLAEPDDDDAALPEMLAEPEAADEPAAADAAPWAEAAAVPPLASADHATQPPSLPAEPVAGAAEAPDAALAAIADRLERIARSLREQPRAELIRAGADPLEALIAGYALGYSEAARRGQGSEHGGR